MKLFGVKKQTVSADIGDGADNTGDDASSPIGQAMSVNEAACKKQQLLLGGAGAHSPDYLPANSFVTSRVIVGVDASAGFFANRSASRSAAHHRAGAVGDDQDPGVSDQRRGARRPVVREGRYHPTKIKLVGNPKLSADGWRQTYALPSFVSTGMKLSHLALAKSLS